jgi:hypothetical protein
MKKLLDILRLMWKYPPCSKQAADLLERGRELERALAAVGSKEHA